MPDKLGRTVTRSRSQGQTRHSLGQIGELLRLGWNLRVSQLGCSEAIHLERCPEQNEATDGSISCRPSEHHGLPHSAGSVGMSANRSGPSRGSFVSLGRESMDSQRENPFGVGRESSGFRGASGVLGIRLG